MYPCILRTESINLGSRPHDSTHKQRGLNLAILSPNQLAYTTYPPFCLLLELQTSISSGDIANVMHSNKKRNFKPYGDLPAPVSTVRLCLIEWGLVLCISVLGDPFN